MVSRLSAGLSSATQHAMPPELGGKWETLCVRYNVKPIFFEQYKKRVCVSIIFKENEVEEHEEFKIWIYHFENYFSCVYTNTRKYTFTLWKPREEFVWNLFCCIAYEPGQDMYWYCKWNTSRAQLNYTKQEHCIAKTVHRNRHFLLTYNIEASRGESARGVTATDWLWARSPLEEMKYKFK